MKDTGSSDLLSSPWSIQDRQDRTDRTGEDRKTDRTGRPSPVKV